MGTHTNRPHARSAATMGNAEGFMQVHVADVRTQLGRPHDAHLRVKVGTVEIDLATTLVNDLADIND